MSLLTFNIVCDLHNTHKGHGYINSILLLFSATVVFNFYLFCIFYLLEYLFVLMRGDVNEHLNIDFLFFLFSNRVVQLTFINQVLRRRQLMIGKMYRPLKQVRILNSLCNFISSGQRPFELLPSLSVRPSSVEHRTS